MATYVLGINCSGFHSSAALFKNGKLIRAICEERLSRVKRDKSFPTKAITYCLESCGVQKQDVSDIFIGWNPRFYLHRSDNMANSALQNRGQLAYLALNELSGLQEEGIDEIREFIRAGNVNWNIHFVDHHHAHLANAFYQSGFEEADYLIADGFGEFSTGMTGTISSHDIIPNSVFRTPHSIGLFYSAFTDFMGFHHNGDEWKVMALSALGNPEEYFDVIEKMISVHDTNIEIDLSFFEYYLPFTPKYYSPKLIDAIGPAYKKGGTLDQRGYDIVAAVQKVVEVKIAELLTNAQARTKSKNLVVSGGFFMNSVLNGKLKHLTPYSSVYVGGSPDDSGVSIGSAYYGLRHILKVHNDRNAKEIRHNYFGKTYTDADIIAELEKRKLPYQVISNLSEEISDLLVANKIIGWFQGGSEFGQRALGNRSILASPCTSEMKDMVNATIKFREGFRPFAPAVLEEWQHEICDMDKGDTSFFMEKVFPIKVKWRDNIPAVVHFDGSGRVQTVSKSLNSTYHALISSFYEKTGVPVLLNTSFNINGMPMVESPADAIDCFYQSGLDALVLHSFLILKNNA